MRLLVVDNDTAILELLKLGLEDRDYQVTTAESGLEALRAIERDPPDVVVTDLVMPNISGDKLLRIVRSVPAWRSIRTIVLSAVAKEAPELRPEIPCDVYIAKGPVATVIELIHQAIVNLDSTATHGESEAVGLDSIYSRRITRELLDFKRDVDLILDHMSDGVCKIGSDLSIIWTNTEFCRLVAQPEERILGHRLTDFVTEEYHAIVERIVREGITTAQETSGGVAATIRGTERIVRARVLYNLSIGGGEAAMLWRDVTQHLLAEEQFENIVQSSNEIIWAADRGGRLTFLSGAARRIAGWSPDEMVGRPIWTLVAETDRGAMQQHTRSLLAGLASEPRDAIHSQEWRFVDPRGELRWVENRISPLRARGDTLIGIQGALTDITERRRLEDERAALLHEVHHRVRDNLQLVGSLARLSDPPTLERRIAAIGEAFDELYRESSFARVAVAQLGERVSIGAISALGLTPNPEVSFSLCDTTLPMRRAAPVSLALSDAIARVGSVIEAGRRALIEVGLCPQGDRMKLRVAVLLSEATLSGEAIEAVRTDEMLPLFVDQLTGDLVIESNDTRVTITITFPND